MPLEDTTCRLKFEARAVFGPAHLLIAALIFVAVGCSSCSTDKQTREKQPEPGAEQFLQDAREKIDAKQYTEARALVEIADEEGADQRETDGLKAKLERQAAEQAREDGELDKVYEHLREAAELEPSPETRFADLMAAVEAGRAVGAPAADLAELASQATEIQTSSKPAQQAAARLWDDAAELDRALPHYQWLHKVDPQDIAVALRLGNIYLANGQLRIARRTFEKILKAEADHVIAGLKAAQVYARLGSHEQAEQLYERLVEAHPERAGILMRYANYLDEQGRSARAKRLRERAREARPSVEKRKMRKLR